MTSLHTPAPSVKTDAETAILRGLASPRPSLSWPYFVENLTRAELTRVHNADHAAKRPAFKCGNHDAYHVRPFEVAQATFRAVLAARPRPFAEPDPVDVALAAGLASVRPRVDGFGEYPIGLSDYERSEVICAGMQASRRAGYTKQAERASVQAARYRLKVLLAARPRPEPTATIPPLRGGAPVERLEDAHYDRQYAESAAIDALSRGLIPPDVRRRVVRGWTDHDQYAAHGCV